MNNILITGVACSGKSYLAKEWAKKGIKTMDGDTMGEVCQWIASNGDIVSFPDDIKLADVEWFKAHKFIWNEANLQEFLKKNEPVIVLGICDNLFDVIKYFDKVYYLKIPYNIAKERLLYPDRQQSNAFGRYKEQRVSLEKIIDETDREAVEAGLEIIDATLSADEILEKTILCAPDGDRT